MITADCGTDMAQADPARPQGSSGADFAATGHLADVRVLLTGGTGFVGRHLLPQLLQAQGITSCVLVCHSLGALIGTAYAAGLGNRLVHRLVLISPAGGYGGETPADKREKVRDERRGALRTLGVDGIAERIPARLLSDGASAADRAWVQWNASRLHPKGYLQAVELLCNTDLGAYRPQSTPIEVHCGEADVVTPPAQCANWAATLAAPFALIAGAGHASPVQQPAAVARLACAAVPGGVAHG